MIFSAQPRRSGASYCTGRKGTVFTWKIRSDRISFYLFKIFNGKRLSDPLIPLPNKGMKAALSETDTSGRWVEMVNIFWIFFWDRVSYFLLCDIQCTGKKILPAFTQSMVTPLKAPLCKQFHLEVARRTDWFFWIIPQFDLSVPLLFMDDTGATHSLIPRLPIVYRIEDDYYETANEDIFLMNSLETGGSIST